MTTPAAAPTGGAPPAAPAQPATPSPAKPEPAKTPGNAPPPPAAAQGVEATKDKIEQAGETPPEQKRGESDQDYEVRLASTLRELKQARRKVQQLEGLQPQLEAMKAELEKAKNKRISKKEFVEMVKQLDAGKLELTDDEWDSLPAAVRDRIERLETAAQQRERQEREQGQQAQRVKEEGIVSNRLKEMVADAPLLAGLEGAASDVLDWWYDEFQRTKVKPDLDVVIAEVNAGLAKTVVAALQSEASRQFLLRAHPELKSLFAEQKAMTSSPPSEAKGPGAANGRGAAPAHSEQPGTAPPNRPLSRLEEDEAKSARMKASYDAWVAEKRAAEAEAARKG